MGFHGEGRRCSIWADHSRKTGPTVAFSFLASIPSMRRFYDSWQTSGIAAQVIRLGPRICLKVTSNKSVARKCTARGRGCSAL